MNVNIYYTKAYNNETASGSRKNKPNSNPIKPNLRKAQMNVNSLITKDYRKNDAFVVRKNKPNSNPTSVKPKMSANLYIIEDYENETAFRPQKNKPNSKPISNECKAGYCPGVFRLIQLRKLRVDGCTVGPVPGGLYGDPELEFAVLDTYGYSSLEFFKGYGKPRPVDSKARIRRKLYIVYELIKYAFIRFARGKSMSTGRSRVAHCKRILDELE
ncbi:MAG: fructosamine kinase family protein [Planctomycetota bacterium]